MKLEKSGKIIVLLFAIGVLILGISTLLVNPLGLFLTVVGGSGLVVLATLAQVYFMVADMRAHMSAVDKSKEIL